MIKFTQRFEKHEEVIKAIYIPQKLHLTIFYDESFDKGDVKRITVNEIDRANLRNSVETLSFYPETKIETVTRLKSIKSAKTCRDVDGLWDSRKKKCYG